MRQKYKADKEDLKIVLPEKINYSEEHLKMRI
jgi:hypothetical protein